MKLTTRKMNTKGLTRGPLLRANLRLSPNGRSLHVQYSWWATGILRASFMKRTRGFSMFVGPFCVEYHGRRGA